MHFMKKTAIGATAVAAVLFSQGSMALQAGDNIVYVGGAYLSPSSSIGTLTSTGTCAAVPCVAPPGINFNQATAGATAKVQSASTFIVTAFHMFTDNIGAELTVGVPVKMKVDMTVPVLATSVTSAAQTKASFPSLVVKYLFNKPTDAFRPYVGLGINYLYFSGTSVSSSPVVQALAGSSQSLSSSWNPVFNAGGIYSLNDRWSVNVGISYVPMKTNATFVGSGTTTTGKLTINPTDVTIKLGYKF